MGTLSFVAQGSKVLRSFGHELGLEHEHELELELEHGHGGPLSRWTGDELWTAADHGSSWRCDAALG